MEAAYRKTHKPGGWRQHPQWEGNFSHIPTTHSRPTWTKTPGRVPRLSGKPPLPTLDCEGSSQPMVLSCCQLSPDIPRDACGPLNSTRPRCFTHHRHVILEFLQGDLTLLQSLQGAPTGEGTC